MAVRPVRKLYGAEKLCIFDNTIAALMSDGSVKLCGERTDYAQRLEVTFDGFGYDIGDIAADSRRIILTDNAHGCYSVDENGFAVSLGTIGSSVAVTGGAVFAVSDANGRVVTDDTSGAFSQVAQWENIVQIAADNGCVFGLREDGSVVVCGPNAGRFSDMAYCRNISSITAGCGMAAAVTSIGRVQLFNGGDIQLVQTRPVKDAALGEQSVLLLYDNGETEVFGGDTAEPSYMSELGGTINITSVAAGPNCAAVVQADGTVLATGIPIWDFDTRDWRDIVAVDAGYGYFAGLHRDGTVSAVSFGGGMSVVTSAAELSGVKQIAAGSGQLTVLRNNGIAEGAMSLSGCKGIIQAAAGEHHVALLRSDGGVECEGSSNLYGECEAIAWRDIKALACGANHTLGLRSDGTVIAVGCNRFGQCDVDKWRDIIAIAAGADASYGVRADGTVVAAGEGEKCNVSGWSNVRSVAAGSFYAVGVRYDGSLLYAGAPDALQETGFWNDIVCAAADIDFIALRGDGTVLTAEYSGDFT